LENFFFEKAVSEYLAGSRDQAIDSLEKSLKYEAGNNDAKKILCRLLVQRAGDSFYNDDLEKSFIDIRRAKSVLPEDPRVNRMYKFIKEAFDERFKPRQAEEQKEVVRFMTGAYLESKTPVVKEKGWGGEFAYLAAGFAVMILVLFLAVLMAFDRLYKMRTHDMYMQKVELERVKWAVTGGKAHGVKDPSCAASEAAVTFSKAPSEMQRLLKNPSLQVRVKGMMILEAEMLLGSGARYKAQAASLIDPLLTDEDPLVAANASRVMSSININKGIASLERLMRDGRQEKAAAIYSLGYVASDRAVSLLLQSIKNKDGKIAAAAVNSLLKISGAGFKGVSGKYADEARKALALLVVKKEGRQS